MKVSSATSPIIRKLLISATAAGVSLAMITPAMAGGRHHGGYYYQPRHYDYGYYSGYRHYDHRRHHRGGISAGEGALIAAGILGGIILIDRAFEDRDRYDDRYDDRRYNERDRRGAFDDGYYYQRDERPYEDRYAQRRDDDRYRSAGSDANIDDILLGDGALEEGRADRRVVPADAAFRECVAETRGAAGAGGMTVAMPGAPTDVEPLADGSVRMTAQFRASNARGESWTRRFVCEADDRGVRFLQVD